ncbi:hypothetical protein PUT72_08635 [Vibrio alginolyticus]|uniref:hypothetical protein n=1 Tax=Vibrio TaxID=662 RepID=UPI001EEE96AC|nr:MULTISPECIES: hypothetical protein [Vibrio]ELB2831778.1 hypothetical protein [Vibrio alginolyticus]ELB2836339.1 hypothetical protein [Vibrio alginolyticus]EMC2463372.1 hypothetical protein [Vibrio alginolyticus]MCR9589926.1 hypothetical protein [Vibrio alginolyticus]MDW1907469.1 hypothetical protein [Vibrio sp. 705]
MEEPETLAMLHHRFGRTIEIMVAYRSFLNNEVNVGDEFSCINDDLRQQVTHTLLITLYSYIYSLFDPSAVNLKELPNSVIEPLEDEAKQALSIAVAEWDKIKTPISKIRSNIGFHHSKKERGANCGYSSFYEVHPLSPVLIVDSLRLFFRCAYQFYTPREPMPLVKGESQITELMEHVLELKGLINETDPQKLVQMLLQQ